MEYCCSEGGGLRARNVANSSLRIARNTIIRSAAEIVNITLSAAFLIYVARKLGNATYGIYAFSLSFAGIFVILSDFGLHIILTREIVKNSHKAREYIGNVFLVKLVLSLAVFAVIWATTAVADYTAIKTKTLFLMALFVTGTSFLDFFNSIYRAHEDMHYESLIMVLNRATIVCSGIYALHLDSGLDNFILAILGANLLWVAISGVFCSIKYGKPRLVFDKDLVVSFFRKGFAVGLMLVFTVVYLKADTIIIEAFKGDAVVGWYNVSHRLIEILLSFATFYSAAIFPSFASSFRTSQGSTATIYQNSIRFLLIIGLPCALAVSFWSNQIILLAFGQAFMEAAPALQILVWAGLLACVNMVTKYLMIAADMQKINALLLGVCTVANIVLNLMLIPTFSHIGASFALLASETIYFLSSYLTIKKKGYVQELLINSWKPLIAVGGSSIVVIYLGLGQVAISCPLFFFIYFVIAFLLKTLRSEDKLFLKKLLQLRSWV
ncbi:MAG: hypothetical protein DRH11_12485 [Deltaproteobacteria bacterium]|nr:MAG: hypothetical protein DRH11_12485 [Deltaproteobacteria bacterium]